MYFIMQNSRSLKEAFDSLRLDSAIEVNRHFFENECGYL